MKSWRFGCSGGFTLSSGIHRSAVVYDYVRRQILLRQPSHRLLRPLSLSISPRRPPVLQSPPDSFTQPSGPKAWFEDSLAILSTISVTCNAIGLLARYTVGSMIPLSDWVSTLSVLCYHCLTGFLNCRQRDDRLNIPLSGLVNGQCSVG